jgi:hypothetical protein
VIFVEQNCLYGYSKSMVVTTNELLSGRASGENSSGVRAGTINDQDLLLSAISGRSTAHHGPLNDVSQIMSSHRAKLILTSQPLLDHRSREHD